MYVNIGMYVCIGMKKTDQKTSVLSPSPYGMRKRTSPPPRVFFYRFFNAVFFFFFYVISSAFLCVHVGSGGDNDDERTDGRTGEKPKKPNETRV